MSNITCISRGVARELAQEAIEVLTKHFAAKGITISKKGGVYTTTDFKLPIIFTVKQDGAGNEVLTEREREYNSARTFNTKMLPLGSQIMHGGERWTIVGYAPRSYKYPVIARNSKGITYKLPQQACEKR